MEYQDLWFQWSTNCEQLPFLPAVKKVGGDGRACVIFGMSYQKQMSLKWSHGGCLCGLPMASPGFKAQGAVAKDRTCAGCNFLKGP